MAARGWLTVLGALGASLMITGADAAAKKATRAKAEPPLMRGCTMAVAPACAGMEAGGQRYVFLGANPPIPVNAGVDVYGAVGGVSICLGIPVNVTSWKPNQLRCPAK
jgi:hypothetical protein